MLVYLDYLRHFGVYSIQSIIQSLGFVAPATFLASCRQGIFFVPLVLILPRLLGMTGIQLTQAVADIITFVISIPFHIYMIKNKLGDGYEKANI